MSPSMASIVVSEEPVKVSEGTHLRAAEVRAAGRFTGPLGPLLRGPWQSRVPLLWGSSTFLLPKPALLLWLPRQVLSARRASAICDQSGRWLLGANGCA